MHAYFIYADLNTLTKYDDIEEYLIENVIPKEMPGNLWLVNFTTLTDLYELLKIDNSELKLILQKDKFVVYNTTKTLKDKFNKLNYIETCDLSVQWKEKSFPQETNTFDICGYLLEATNYIQNSKDKTLNLFLAIVRE